MTYRNNKYVEMWNVSCLKKDKIFRINTTNFLIRLKVATPEGSLTTRTCKFQTFQANILAKTKEKVCEIVLAYLARG